MGAGCGQRILDLRPAGVNQYTFLNRTKGTVLPAIRKKPEEAWQGNRDPNPGLQPNQLIYPTIVK